MNFYYVCRKCGIPIGALAGYCWMCSSTGGSRPLLTDRDGSDA